VAVTQKKNQKQHYVPQRQVKAVVRGVQQHDRLLEIVERVTTINLILMRKGVLNESDE